MSFPDLGPLYNIARPTVDGLIQGGILFQTVSGNMGASGPSLWYIALTMALVGFLSIFLMEKNQSLPVVASWFYLVSILLIAPYNTDVFFQTKDVPKTSHVTTTNTGAPSQLGLAKPGLIYVPQAAVIDIMSKVHRAIFDAFFHVVDTTTGETRLHNALADLGNKTAFGQIPEMSLNGNPGALSAIAAYQSLCGSPNDLLLEPYNSTNHPSGGGNGTAPTPPANDYTPWQLPDDALYNRTFTFQQVHNAIIMFERNFANNTNAPRRAFSVFAIGYDTKDKLEQSLTKRGVSTTVVAQAVNTYMQGNYEKALNSNAHADLRYALVSASPTEAIIPVPSQESKPSHPVAPEFITAVTNSNGFHDSSMGSDVDPIERRFLNWFSSDKTAYPSDQEASTANAFANMPVAVAFLTRKPSDFYSGDQGINNDFQLEVAHNCADLHQSVRRQVTELLLREAFMGYSSPDQAYLPPTGDLLDKVGLLVNNVDDYSANSLDNNADFGLRTSTMPNGQQATVSIWPSADAPSDTKQEATLRKYFESLLSNQKSPGNLINTKEKVRKEIVYSALDTAMQRATGILTSISTPTTQELTTDKGIEHEMSGGISRNLGTGGVIVAAIGEKIADWASGIVQWFVGAVALLYVKFLQDIVGLALLFILMVTPLLYMMGLMVPGYAPGVIGLSIIAVVILKMVPITYTVTDAVISVGAQIMQADHSGHYTTLDQTIFTVIAAGLYTSTVMLTMFLMFKVGDVGSVAQLAKIDGAAEKAADKTANAAQGLAITGAAIATAGTVGMAAGAKTAFTATEGSFKQKALAGLKHGAAEGGMQAFEVVGRSAGSIPIVSDILKEANPAGTWREGRASTGDIINNPETGSRLAQMFPRIARSSAPAQLAADEKYAKMRMARAKVGAPDYDMSKVTSQKLAAQKTVGIIEDIFSPDSNEAAQLKAKDNMVAASKDYAKVLSRKYGGPSKLTQAHTAVVKYANGTQKDIPMKAPIEELADAVHKSMVAFSEQTGTSLDDVLSKEGSKFKNYLEAAISSNTLKNDLHVFKDDGGGVGYGVPADASTFERIGLTGGSHNAAAYLNELRATSAPGKFINKDGQDFYMLDFFSHDDGTFVPKP